MSDRVTLEGPGELIAEPLATRPRHFMGASLVDSQFATLEPPGPDERPITVGIDLPPEEIVKWVSGILLSSGAPGNSAQSNREGT